MSRNTDKIRALADELGLRLVEVTWTPIGQNFEMCGPSGGWFVCDALDYDYMGYNIGEVLANMREYGPDHAREYAADLAKEKTS